MPYLRLPTLAITLVLLQNEFIRAQSHSDTILPRKSILENSTTVHSTNATILHTTTYSHVTAPVTLSDNGHTLTISSLSPTTISKPDGEEIVEGSSLLILILPEVTSIAKSNGTISTGLGVGNSRPSVSSISGNVTRMRNSSSTATASHFISRTSLTRAPHGNSSRTSSSTFPALTSTSSGNSSRVNTTLVSPSGSHIHSVSTSGSISLSVASNTTTSPISTTQQSILSGSLRSNLTIPSSGTTTHGPSISSSSILSNTTNSTTSASSTSQQSSPSSSPPSGSPSLSFPTSSPTGTQAVNSITSIATVDQQPVISTVTSVVSGTTHLIPVIIGGVFTTPQPLQTTAPPTTIVATGTHASSIASSLSSRINAGIIPIIQAWTDNPSKSEADKAVSAIKGIIPDAENFLSSLGGDPTPGKSPCTGSKKRGLFPNPAKVVGDIIHSVACVVNTLSKVSGEIDSGEDSVNTVTSDIQDLSDFTTELDDDEKDKDQSQSESQSKSETSESQSESKTSESHTESKTSESQSGSTTSTSHSESKTSSSLSTSFSSKSLSSSFSKSTSLSSSVTSSCIHSSMTQDLYVRCFPATTLSGSVTQTIQTCTTSTSTISGCQVTGFTTTTTSLASLSSATGITIVEEDILDTETLNYKFIFSVIDGILGDANATTTRDANTTATGSFSQTLSRSPTTSSSAASGDTTTTESFSKLLSRSLTTLITSSRASSSTTSHPITITTPSKTSTSPSASTFSITAPPIPQCSLQNEDPDQGINNRGCVCGSTTLPLLQITPLADESSSCSYTAMPTASAANPITIETETYTTNCQACTLVGGLADPPTCTSIDGCTPTLAPSLELGTPTPSTTTTASPPTCTPCPIQAPPSINDAGCSGDYLDAFSVNGACSCCLTTVWQPDGR